MTLGRKNWLSRGSDGGGTRAAAIMSLVQTARLNGLDSEAYLRQILERIAEPLPWSLRGVASRLNQS